MTRHGMRFGLIGLVLAGLLSIGSRTVDANGDEFFSPPAGDGPVTLVYFGLLKDSAGHPLDSVDLLVISGGERFRFVNNAPGHYRSPDIGAYYKNLGDKFRPDSIEIMAGKPGYQSESKTFANKADGSFEIDFTLKKDAEEAGGATGDAPAEPGRPSWLIPALLVAAGLIGVAAVRVSSRRRAAGDSGPASV